MEIHECSAGDETAMLWKVHSAIQEGPGTYDCTVAIGIGIAAAANEIKLLFPEVDPDSIQVNMGAGIIRFTTVSRPMTH